MTRPIVVGIVNATPDSFSDGGIDDLVGHAQRLIEEGADWLDIGGESTRPGAQQVDPEQEWSRIAPVIDALRGSVPLSVDTSKASVAAQALKAGVEIINDVTGLGDPEMAAVTADARVAVVMHMRGNPSTMKQLTQYGDVVTEVRDALVAAAQQVQSEQVFIDPGIGFAKNAEQSLALLRHTEVLVDTGFPVYIGASRKSFIGQTLGIDDPLGRVPGSIAAACAALQQGATAFRVHDVAPHRQALDLMRAIIGADSLSGSGLNGVG